jgi:hypothetical protein
VPDSESAARYFRWKFSQWAYTEGSAAAHITRVGRGGLADEFRADPAFGEVCEFVRLAGRAQLRSSAYQSAEGFLSDLFGVPLAPIIEIVLAAVADACGYKTEAEELAQAAAQAVVTIAAVAIIGGIIATLLSKR